MSAYLKSWAACLNAVNSAVSCPSHTGLDVLGEIQVTGKINAYPP